MSRHRFAHRFGFARALAPLLAAALLALASAPQTAFAQYGGNPPPQSKPRKPEAAEPPAPAPVKPPAPATPPGATSKSSASQPAAAKPVGQHIDVEPADVKWLDRLPKDDRAALDELLGWAPPKLSSDLQWIGAEPLNWNALRGKVIVIQSFTTANIVGRKWPERVADALKPYEAKDLKIIALHTPEGADSAKDFLAKKPAPARVAVAVDPKGEYCDLLAIYKRPTSILIDRNGAVRYAGLNEYGLAQAVKLLVAEPFDQKVIVAERPDEHAEAGASSATAAADWPPITGDVGRATDIRGKRAPDFHVDDWLTAKPPDASGKVVVIDFWATWCSPCVASIPHMNTLAARFRDDVVCVGISDEKRMEFERGMDKLKDKSITLKSFQYAVALDPARKMYEAINISAIPHCIVMDRNWIVRWQGHPASLDEATLQQIVKADKAQAAGGGGAGAGAGAGSGDAKPSKPGGPKRKRWVNG